MKYYRIYLMRDGVRRYVIATGSGIGGLSVGTLPDVNCGQIYDEETARCIDRQWQKSSYNPSGELLYSEEVRR